MGMEQQEIIYRLQIMEQQLQQLQQQMQSVDKGIIELESLNIGMDEIPKSQESEIFAQIGKGIYARAKIISDELLVNIGENSFVNRSVSETKKMIQQQTQKLKEIKKELENNSELTNGEIMNMIQQYQDSERKVKGK